MINFLITNQKNNTKDFFYNLSHCQDYQFLIDKKIYNGNSPKKIIYYTGDGNIDLSNNKNKLYLSERFFIFDQTKKNKLKITTDHFSKFDLFYSFDKNFFFISNNFEIILNRIKNKNIDQIATAHALNVLGIRPPKKDTFIKEIKRLGINQKILIDKKKINITENNYIPENTHEYSDQKIKEYFHIHKHFFLKKLGKSKKSIFMSSGFDSSFLAALNVSLYGKNNLKGYTLVQRFSNRSKIYNKFEIERIKKLKKFFDIKIKFTELNLVDDFQKYSEELQVISKKNMLTNTIAAFMHNKLSHAVKNDNFSKNVIAGEVSDGAHNFGFSQFYTLIDHESQGFREYGDKKINYLYSPTFAKKILNQSYKYDAIFKEIKSRTDLSVKKKDKYANIKEVFFELSNSLFNTNSRIPLNANYPSYFKKNIIVNLNRQIQKNYFNKVKIESFDQLYSSYLYLYSSFHWQASTINTMYAYPNSKNLNMTLPFWNYELISFLSKMPEDWGRGLELRNIKYPMKESFRRFLKFPSDILNKGHHSYLYDIKKYSDPNLEILISKKTKKFVLSIFNKYHPCDLLDRKFFDQNLIYKKILNYKNNKSFNGAEIFRLYNISKFFSDINY